ncbi:MAG TPA: hypothetical protein VGF55_13795 [Gemmataceae bacterium]|jgi:hypothetical protein
MSAQPIHELREFHRFLGEKMNAGEASLSPEDVLDEWRSLHPDPDDVAAIQEAIDDLENGDTGVPFEEFDQDFRARHNLPPRS